MESARPEHAPRFVQSEPACSSNSSSSRGLLLLWKMMLEMAGRSSSCATREKAATLIMPSLELPRHLWLLHTAAVTRRVFLVPEAMLGAPMSVGPAGSNTAVTQPQAKAPPCSTDLAERVLKVLTTCIMDELAGIHLQPSDTGMGFWLEDVSTEGAHPGQLRLKLHVLLPGCNKRMAHTLIQRIRAGSKRNLQALHASAPSASPTFAALSEGRSLGMLRSKSTTCSSPRTLSGLTPAAAAATRGTASTSASSSAGSSPMARSASWGPQSTCSGVAASISDRTLVDGISPRGGSQFSNQDSTDDLRKPKAAAGTGTGTTAYRMGFMSTNSSETDGMQGLRQGSGPSACVSLHAAANQQPALRKRASGLRRLFVVLLHATCACGAPRSGVAAGVAN